MNYEKQWERIVTYLTESDEPTSQMYAKELFDAVAEKAWRYDDLSK